MPRHHNNQPWRAPLHNPAVSSSSLVQLTLPGLALIDRAVETTWPTRHRILSALKAADLAALDHRLALLLAALESQRSSDPAPSAVTWWNASKPPHHPHRRLARHGPGHGPAAAQKWQHPDLHCPQCQPDLALEAKAAGVTLEQWQQDLSQGEQAAHQLQAWLNAQGPQAFASATLINNAGVIPRIAPLSASDAADQ